STGQPKGVMIDHRGALNTVLDINRRWQVESRDRIFCLSSLSFDLSVYDIFGALAAGAALVLPAADSLREPRHW
ncbi:AMP-binding protein, partial [Pseudomonas gingeri]